MNKKINNYNKLLNYLFFLSLEHFPPQHPFGFLFVSPSVDSSPFCLPCSFGFVESCCTKLLVDFNSIEYAFVLLSN